ncbi:MAG: acetylglutamate kinase [Pseudomonadota bacterium]
MTTTSTRETIVQLLSNMSDGKEIRSYLQRFSEVDRTRFAVIKIGGAILAEQLEETASALAFLHTVGLTPIVLHGGGPQLDVTLKERKIETNKIDGLRVTDAATLDAARDVFIAENIKLVEAIRAQGTAAHSLTTGAIEADYLDQKQYGFVGEPTGVRLELIDSIVKSGAIPILTCLGLAPGGQLVNVNADSATRALVHALQPMKIIFLAGVGGLLDAEGAVIHSINLASDYDDLMGSAHVEGGMRLKLQEIKRLLDDAPLSSSVSITTPAGLVRELFTHGGSGTLIRKGEIINHYTDKKEVDGSRATALVENAFARTLVKDWWGGVEISAAYVSDSYRAAALLSKVTTQDGERFDYLDKFAVLEDARGEGLARTVWRRFSADIPAVFWRSRTENGFNAFYGSVADGSVKRGPWTVYWMGETEFARIAAIVDHVAEMKPSFEGD